MTAIITAYRFLYLSLASLIGYGWAIVALSFICSALMLPFMRAVAGIVNREKEYESVIDPQIAAIKRIYASDMDRHFHTQSLYARYAYSPLAPIKKVLPLFVQIPFLLLTYYMLKGTAELSGVSFLFLPDLGQPDALISISTANLNLLPIVMTGVNILTVFSTPGFTHKDWTQAIAISFLFLALLYTAPSALLLYWTLNNTITFVRTLCEKHFAGAKLLVPRIVVVPHYLNPLLCQRWISSCMLTFFDVTRSKLHETSLKGVAFRSVFGLLIINIFVLLPVLFVLLYRAPKNYEINICNAVKPIVVWVGFENKTTEGGNFTECAKRLKVRRVDDGKYLLREYFADSEDVERAILKFESSPQKLRLSSIVITRFDCLTRTLTPAEFAKGYHGRNGEPVSLDSEGYAVITVGQNGFCEFSPVGNGVPNWSNVAICVKGKYLPRLSSVYFFIFEFVLLLFSILCAIFINHKASIKGCVWFSVGIATLFVSQIVYFVPLEAYLPNAGEFPIALPELLISLNHLASIVWPILAIGLFLSRITFGYMFHYAVFSFLVYEYFQLGVLLRNEPSFNGAVNYYLQQSLQISDIVLMIFVAIASLFLYYLHKKIMIYAMSVFFIMNAITLLGTKSVSKFEDEVNGKCSTLAAVKGFRPSSEKNVLVFVLDSLSTEVVSDVFEKNPDIAAEFDGFTMYKRNLGMHHETDIATVGMLTGLYYRGRDDKLELMNHMKLPFSTGVLSNYWNSSFNITFVPSAYQFGLSRPKIKDTAVCQEKVSPLFRRPETGSLLSLYEYVKFRLTPLALKIPVYFLIRGGWENKIRVDEEQVLYRMLTEVSLYATPTFGFFHTHGAHIPHDINADGIMMKNGERGYKAYYDHAMFCIKELKGLMKAMKKKGWYDNSYLIITADHGPHDDIETKATISGNMLPPHARPFIMVKPILTHAPIAYDNITPTSHVKIHELLDAALTYNVTGADTRKIMSEENDRTFVLTTQEGYKEWHVNSSGDIQDFAIRDVLNDK